MALGNPGFTAGGDISTSRFVLPTSADNFTVVQATAATTVPLGISQESTRRAPNVDITNADLAAIATEQLRVYQNTDTCYLNAGHTFDAGALLKSDANGRGVTATTGTYYGARALEASTASGQNIRVQVFTGYLA